MSRAWRPGTRRDSEEARRDAVSERKHRSDRSPQRRPAEGVRIIPADEAQAALDAGEATGRRSEDELRFGDVPPAPQGPRSPHRFPLPDSVDPAGAVSLPPLASSGRSDQDPSDTEVGGPDDSQPALWGGQPAAPRTDEPPGGESGLGDRTAELGIPAAVMATEAEDPARPESSPLPDPVSAEPRTLAISAEPETNVASVSPTGSTSADRARPVASGQQTFASTNDQAEDEPAFAASPSYRPDSGSTSRPWVASPSDTGLSREWTSSGPGSAASSEWGGGGPSSGGSGEWGGGGPSSGGSGEWAASPGPRSPSSEWAAPVGSAPSSGPPSGGGREHAPGAWAAGTVAGEGVSPAAGTWASGSSGATGSGSDWRSGQSDPQTSSAPPGGPTQASSQPPGRPDTPASEDPPTASRSAGDPDPGRDHAPGASRPVEPSPLAPPEEGITVTGGGTELPHWTDPPTGEVPRILAEDPNETEPSEDDLAAWNALGSQSMRWRDESDDWSDAHEIGELGGDEAPVGALDQTRSEHSDLYSFDEDFERVEAERTSVGAAAVIADFDDDDLAPETEAAENRARQAAQTRPRGRTGAHGPSSRPPGRVGPPVGSGGSGRDDLATRVAVGAGLIILLLIAYAIGSKALVVLAAAVVVAAAAEAYGMLQRSGFRPATLLGLVATVGLVFGAYWKGIDALPLAAVLVFAGSMMWYLLRIVEARPLANVAVTTMAFVWVGILGSYSAVMLRASHGKGLLLGAVVVAIAADIGAFAVGRTIGSRPMAPSISPGKTIEGFIGGLVAALIVGAIVGKELTPWGGTRHGLVLGLIVGLAAPAGDLFESMIKRDLGVKDSGMALPGHGGLLDRFDSILLALPAAYYLATIQHIVK